jgi:hypothetical protein
MDLRIVNYLACRIDGDAKMLKELEYQATRTNQPLAENPTYTKVIRSMRSDALELVEELK